MIDPGTRVHAGRLAALVVLAACAPPERGDHGGADGGGGNGGGGSGGGGAGGGGGGPGGAGGGGPPTSCRGAESKQSVVGCLFYGLDTDNSDSDDKKIFGFPVGNPGSAPASVKVQKKEAGAWVDEVGGTVPPGQISYLRIASGPAAGKDRHIEGSGKDGNAYRISSDAPVVVYQINADDEMATSISSGSTMLLPAHALGRQHFAIAPPERGIPAHPNGGPDKGFVSVVGTTAGTRVTVRVTGATLAGGPVPALAAGGSYEGMLDEGDVLQLETAAVGSDLTGTEVTSDKPVAVYAGNTCGGFDPARVKGGYPPACDHVEEAMYPVTTWGRSFVVLDMRMPKHEPSPAVWARVVASEDGTTLTFDAPIPLPGVPSGPVTLDRGRALSIEIRKTMNASGSPRAHFAMDASKPVAVEAFMGTEEGGAVVVPVDQFLDDYLLSAHPYYTGYLMVTRKKGTPVTLDGMPMPDSVFTTAGAGFDVSFVPLARCDTDPSKCGHRVVGAKVGVTVTANGGTCNYCYAGGAGARCVNRTAGCL